MRTLARCGVVMGSEIMKKAKSSTAPLLICCSHMAAPGFHA